jgi:hypothetical protein
MRHNQMMLGVDRDLHVIAHDAGATAARTVNGRCGMGLG